MRRADDPEPLYIRDWAGWERYCKLFGVPADWLCEAQVRGLRDGGGAQQMRMRICSRTLYPEPPGAEVGWYVLDLGKVGERLPVRFRWVGSEPGVREGRGDGEEREREREVVVVYSDGRMAVEMRRMGEVRVGRGYRWSAMPWTEEMEESCRPLTVKLRLWNGVGVGV